MNFNTILYRFGFDPNDFINEENEPIKTEDGFIVFGSLKIGQFLINRN